MLGLGAVSIQGLGLGLKCLREGGPGRWGAWGGCCRWLVLWKYHGGGGMLGAESFQGLELGLRCLREGGPGR